MVLRQGAAARISLLNCSLCIHTSNTEGQVMNSCILSYAKIWEFALEWGQALLVKRSAGLALLLPGCKCALMTAKLGNIFPFLSCSQYCPWHPNGPRYINRDSKNSIRNISGFSTFLRQIFPTSHNVPEPDLWPPRVATVSASCWPENAGDTKLPSVVTWWLWSMAHRVWFISSSNFCSQLAVSLCLFKFMQTMSYFYLCGIITDSWKYLRREIFTVTSQKSCGCFFSSDKLALA